MKKDRRLRRLFVALGISGAINIVWLTLDALTDSTSYQPTRLSKIAGALGYPGGRVANWLTPPGHEATYFVVGALISIVSSLLFYATLAWIVLGLPVWLRSLHNST
jgi:hypothetical protein